MSTNDKKRNVYVIDANVFIGADISPFRSFICVVFNLICLENTLLERINRVFSFIPFSKIHELAHPLFPTDGLPTTAIVYVGINPVKELRYVISLFSL